MPRFRTREKGLVDGTSSEARRAGRDGLEAGGRLCEHAWLVSCGWP